MIVVHCKYPLSVNYQVDIEFRKTLPPYQLLNGRWRDYSVWEETSMGRTVIYTFADETSANQFKNRHSSDEYLLFMLGRE